VFENRGRGGGKSLKEPKRVKSSGKRTLLWGNIQEKGGGNQNLDREKESDHEETPQQRSGDWNPLDCLEGF